MNRAVLVLSLALLVGCHKCSCSGSVPTATANDAGGDWQVVMPQDAAHSVKVDLASIKPADDQDDALEYVADWPLTPQLRQALKAENVENLPDGSKWFTRSRVVCTPRGPIEYDVENRVVDPNGTELRKRAYNPGVERKNATLPTNGGPTDVSAYRQDAGSLVCLVAKTRCAHENFSWPPPPNPAGLGTTDEHKKLRAQYNDGFVPKCKLTGSGAAP